MKEILFPVGRLVGGSLYQGQTKDDKGQPLVFKSGKNAGQPRTQFSFGVAYAKKGEAHWNQTEWGKAVWAEGATGSPKLHQGAHFSWKVTDGDSTVPNKKGNVPAEREGYPGHWVVWYSGNFAPRIVNADGSKPITEPDAVKPGSFVQVFGNCEFNKQTDSPGVYQNFQIVAYAAWGEEIVITGGADASTVGFGGSPLPPGASEVPVGSLQVQDDAPPPPPPEVEPHTAYMEAKPFPPEGWIAHPQAPGWFYNKATRQQLKEADLRAL